MPELLPFEIQTTYPGDHEWRTIYCIFAWDLRDAKEILKMLREANRLAIYGGDSHRVRKWIQSTVTNVAHNGLSTD